MSSKIKEDVDKIDVRVDGDDDDLLLELEDIRSNDDVGVLVMVVSGLESYFLWILRLL